MAGLVDLISGIVGVGDDGGASAVQKDALEQYKKIAVPDPEQQKIELQKMVTAGKITPEQAQTFLQEPSQMGDIATSGTNGTNAESSALNGMQSIVDAQGLTAEDKSRLNDINNQEATKERGAREAITQNAQSRGVGGSGLDLASQLENQQGSATTAANEAVSVNAQAQQAKQAALQGLATTGYNVQGQKFSEEAQKATAEDAINKFNAGQSTDANRLNVNNNLTAATHNSDQNQAATTAGINAQQNAFNNKLGLANANSTESNALAGTDLDKQKRKENFAGGVLEVGGKIAGLPMSRGGKVPGIPMVRGNSPVNDTVPARLSPGEIVVPRTSAHNPKMAMDFVKSVNENETSTHHPHDIEAMLSAMANIRRKKEMCNGGMV